MNVNTTQKIHKKNECKYFDRNTMECKRSKQRKTKLCNTINCSFFEPITPTQNLNKMNSVKKEIQKKNEESTITQNSQQTTTPKRTIPKGGIYHRTNVKSKRANTTKNTRMNTECKYCTTTTYICKNIQCRCYSSICNPNGCINFTPIQLPNFTTYDTPVQEGTHERTSQYRGMSRVMGTPCKVGYIPTGTERRHKNRCYYYHKKENTCGYWGSKCIGSNICVHYYELRPEQNQE